MTPEYDPGPLPHWLTIEEVGEPSREAIVAAIIAAVRYSARMQAEEAQEEAIR